jgi:hypothetical protein
MPSKRRGMWWCLLGAVLTHSTAGSAAPALGRVRPLARPLAPVSPERRNSLLQLRGGSLASPGWLSVMPPVVALGASVALKQVIVALLLGVFSGCMLLANGNPLVAGMRTFDTYLVRAFNAPDHAGVLLFTFLLGGTIGVVQKAGGGIGLSRLLQRYMTSAQRALVCRQWP